MKDGNILAVSSLLLAFILALFFSQCQSNPISGNEDATYPRVAKAINENFELVSRAKRAGGRAPVVAVGKAPVAAGGKAPVATGAGAGASSSSGGTGIGSAIATGAASGLAGVALAKALTGGG